MKGTTETFALVVPTLNEAGNIKALLDRSMAALSESPVQWEIIVVDDESTDSTDEIARRYAESDARIRLVTRHGCRGLAGAITNGWAQSEADILGVIDADLQHPPELLPALIDAVRDGFDLAIASRYVRPHSMDSWSPIRRMISRLSVLASAPVQRRALKVKDPMSGFFVLRRECIAGLSFQPTGFKLLLEILTRGNIEFIQEIPFKFATRQHGKSKANLMTAINYVSLLCHLSFKRKEAASNSIDSRDSSG